MSCCLSSVACKRANLSSSLKGQPVEELADSFFVFGAGLFDRDETQTLYVFCVLLFAGCFGLCAVVLTIFVSLELNAFVFSTNPEEPSSQVREGLFVALLLVSSLQRAGFSTASLRICEWSFMVPRSSFFVDVHCSNGTGSFSPVLLRDTAPHLS